MIVGFAINSPRFWTYSSVSGLIHGNQQSKVTTACQDFGILLQAISRFPQPTDEQREAIAAVARELDQLRNNWLNPPEWTRQEVLEFPGSADGPWSRYIDSVDISLREMKPHAEREDYKIGTVRYPRLVPKDDECARQLAKRTLTNLYNDRPTCLDLAHRRLDESVAAAYHWPTDIADEEILSRLFALNLST